MTKNGFVLCLCAGLLAAGCGGVTEGDIESAARAEENADQASGLRLVVAQFWVQSTTQKETTDDGVLSTAGQFTSNTASITTSESSNKTVHKVMGTTYVESVDKNGYVIATVSQDDAQTGSAAGLLVRSNYVLFELDNWVRTDAPFSNDSDVDSGIATHPINPSAGLLYTDDRGHIFKGEQTETVSNFAALKLNRQFAPDPVGPAEFYAACFVVTPQLTGVDVTRRSSCEGTTINMGSGEVTFNVKHSQSIWVGRQLLLKSVTESEQIIVDEINCGNAPTRLDQGSALLLNNCTGNITFGRSGGSTKRTQTATVEATKFGKSASAKAQPQIEDAK